MGYLQEKLASARTLRESERQEEARQLLLELHSEFPEDPQVNYQCAWFHDLLGLEQAAIPFYEKAIQAGLSGDDLKSALLGMGSTYRCTATIRNRSIRSGMRWLYSQTLMNLMFFSPWLCIMLAIIRRLWNSY